MTDVLKPNQRRSSTTYFALPLSLLRRRFSTHAHPPKIPSPPSLSSTSNDPLSEVIEIGQTSSTSQHTNSHATDERSITTPEDEERQRLRDAAAQSLGLDLNAFNEGNTNPDDSVHYAPSSQSLSMKPTSTTIYNHNYESSPASRHSSSLTSSAVNSIIYKPKSPSNKPPPFPCSYSDLAPFIQISSSYQKFAAPTDTHTTNNGLAFISLTKRSKSVKPHWKLCYVVLTVPRAVSSPGYLFTSQSSQSSQSNNFQPLTNPIHLHARNSPPPPLSPFLPNHSYLHLFKSEHPTRDEIEVDRLEINEDTVVYIADIELAGKRGLIKITGRHVGANAVANDEESSRTLWIFKYPDPRETTNAVTNHRVVYPDESEVQQRWVKEIKSSVLSQRAERAGFLHASSQPTSPRSSLLGNSGSPSTSTNNGWHLPVSPNRQLSLFPQPRPAQSLNLPPPNPNPRYAEHVGAAPSAISNVHHASASSSRYHTPAGALKITNLRSLFRSPSPAEVSSPISKDDRSSIIKNHTVSSTRNTSRPPSRDGSVSVWSGISIGIQRTAIKEEKEEVEPPQRRDIHPMAPDESTEDYATFLTRLNTRFKESLYAKEKEKGSKGKRRPQSTGSMPENNSAHKTTVPNVNLHIERTSNQNEPSSIRSSKLLHPFADRPISPLNEASVASIYSQSSAQDHIKDTQPRGHGHTRSASTGTVSASLPNGKNIAEWVVSTVQAQADDDMRNNDKSRSNERLSIGESLAISLSMNPPPKSQRRSTTISSLAALASKEDWSFPPSSSATVSDGTETPGRVHPYSHQSITPDVIPPIPSQDLNLEKYGHAFEVSSFRSLAASVSPSVRSSIDLKQREIKNSLSAQPENDRRADSRILRHGDGDGSANENTSIPQAAANVENFEPRSVPAVQVHPPTSLNSTKSWFGRSTPPVYKRVSAPPAPLSSTNSSSGLPPPRPPPSFAPPPPPSDQSSNGVESSSSEGLTASKNGSKDSVEKRTGKNIDGGDNTVGPVAPSSLLSRPFRLSLNPSPPPTQPLPPRPDEVLRNVSIAVQSTNDKQLSRQRHRPHSTLAGPRPRLQKALPVDDTERPLFISMYPMSVSALVPAGNAGLKHGDHAIPPTTSSVPAPQPPPQGPLPPTPGSLANSRKETSITSSISTTREPRRSSITRRSRIMSSPPAPRVDYESNSIEADQTNVKNAMISHDETTGTIRSRRFIPAPPRIPPPKPQRQPKEQVPNTVHDSSLEHLLPPADSGVSSTFLHMDDTPKASTFPITPSDGTDDPLHHSRRDIRETFVMPDTRENEFILYSPAGSGFTNSRDNFIQTSRVYTASQVSPEIWISEESTFTEDSGNTNLSPDHNTTPVPINDTNGVHEQLPSHDDVLNLAEVDTRTRATVTTGRITPPSPPSPLSITAQTPSRTTSPSPLSSHSYLHYERSIESESEQENDFDY